MERKKGINKYEDVINDEILRSGEYERFFKFPRQLFRQDYGVSSFDIAVAVAAMNYGAAIHDMKVKTPPLSIELVSLQLSADKVRDINRKIEKSLLALSDLDIFNVTMFKNGLFDIEADLSHGYFAFNYDDFTRMQDIGKTKTICNSIHIYGIINANMFNRHEDDNTFICYRTQSTIGKSARMSRFTVMRTLELLEEIEVIAAYKIQLSGVYKTHKLVFSTFKNRDKLRRYVESQIDNGGLYSKIIDEEDGNEEDDE